MRVYQKYIKNKHAVIMSIVPKGQKARVAAPDNFTPPVRVIPELVMTLDTDLQVRKAQDDFDRSLMPVAGANKAVEVPKMWRETLANGMKILATQSSETPTTSMLIKIPAGHYYESKEKAGTAALLAAMLNESTTKRSAEDMSKALQKLGASVNISAGNDYLSVNINTLTKHIDATLALVYEKVTMPAFLPSEFERNKSNAIQAAINGKKDAGYLASNAYRQLLHGDNIAATSSAGSEASLANIDLADIKALYQAQVQPKGSEIILVSDLNQRDILQSLSIFKALIGEGKELLLTLPDSNAKRGVIYLVNKDNATQAAIRIGKRSLTEDITGEYYRAYLMNFALGGAFNSRINLNLREDKGYTYGARSYFYGDKFSGTFTASAEVRADVTDKSIVEFVTEITRYAEQGISDEELAFMRNAINQKDALKYETPGRKLGFLAQILEHDLTAGFVKERNDIVANITKADINTLAKKHLVLSDMLMVVVGDAKTLKPQLEVLGYQVINYEI
jgi:zinc protease